MPKPNILMIMVDRLAAGWIACYGHPPMRMAVRDGLKYVYVHRQAPQLFDLVRDPHEEHNCIHDPAYAGRLAELERLVHHDWDPEAKRAQVLLSQQRRKWINEAGRDGCAQPWDVEPNLDATQMYVRSHDGQETNKRMRVPRVDV